MTAPTEPRKPAARLLTFVASSSTYTLASIISAAVGFALIPLLTRYLTPTDFGIYGLLYALEALLAPLLIVNAHIMIQRRYSLLGEARVGSLIRTVDRLRVRLLAVALLLAVLVGWLVGTGRVPLWAVAGTVAIAGMDGTVLLTMSLLIMRRRPRQYLAVRLAFLIVSTVVVLATVVGFDADWRGRFVALAAGTAAAAVPGLILLRRYRARSQERLETRDVVRFGAPLAPHTTGIWANNFLDRFIVAALLGVGPAGTYVAAYSVSLAFDAIHTGVSMALVPSTYPRLDSGKEVDRRLIGRVFYTYCAATLLLFAVVAPIATLAVRPLLGPAFARGAELMPWLLLGQSFMGIARIGSTYLYASERTAQRGVLTAITVVLGIVYTVVGVLAAGLMGAAIATAATFATNALLTTAAAWRTGLLPGIATSFRAPGEAPMQR